MGLVFEWDSEKAETNLKKHGISFEEASTVFGDPLSLTIEDHLHSYRETRYVIIGQSYRRRTLVVSHMERRGNIRIISARVATRREIVNYEKKS